MNNIEKGRLGERLAAILLKQNGLCVIARNYRFSRWGELDIICQDDDLTVVFVEVKTRLSGNYGLPIESMGCQKQRQLKKLAQLFLLREKFSEKTVVRFDVVSVRFSVAERECEIKHIANVF